MLQNKKYDAVICVPGFGMVEGVPEGILESIIPVSAPISIMRNGIREIVHGDVRIRAAQILHKIYVEQGKSVLIIFGGRHQEELEHLKYDHCGPWACHYLELCDVPSADLAWVTSTNECTLGDNAAIQRYIKENQIETSELLYVTTQFHLPRAMLLWAMIGDYDGLVHMMEEINIDYNWQSYLVNVEFAFSGLADFLVEALRDRQLIDFNFKPMGAENVMIQYSKSDEDASKGLTSLRNPLILGMHPMELQGMMAIASGEYTSGIFYKEFS